MSIREIRTIHRLQAYTWEDGWENVGHCVFLFFVKGRGTKRVRREFTTAYTAREARATVREMVAQGYELCWKSYGPLYLSPAPRKVAV